MTTTTQALARAAYQLTDGSGRRWLQLLVDVLGYELTEWEAAKVAAADERAAERAAAAAAEEAAGDEDDVVDVVQDL